MRKLIILLFILIPSVSGAAWFTKIDENIFEEKSAMLVGVVSQTSMLMIECKGDDLYLSYIEQDKSSDIKPINLTLLIKIDDNKPIEFSAMMSRRNDDYAEALSRDSAGILSVLSELRSAKRRVMLGLMIKGTDFKASYSGDVYRSTAETNKFIKACDIKYQF